MESQFKYNQYVPVLRWKAAEVDALYNLDSSIKTQIMPIFELCPSMFIRKRIENGLLIKEILPFTTLSKKLMELKGVIGKSPFYMDLINVNDDKSAYSNQSLWEEIIRYGKFIKIPLIPVTGFYNKGKKNQYLIGSVAKEFGNGACIRLTMRELFRLSFHSEIKQLLLMLNLPPSQVDIVIDFQTLSSQKASPAYSQIEEKIPILNEWRSITFVAGSFPKDLGPPMEANNTYNVERLEWLKWKAEIQSDKTSVKRTPRFGDFTIQHAIYNEPPDFANVSASIRYAHDDYWVVIRGEALSKEGGIGHDQYPAEAQLLVDKKEYCGYRYSHGDNIIMQKSKDVSNPGTPETWLMVGINHHITHTVYKLHPDLLVRKLAKEAIAQKPREIQEELWSKSNN